MNTEYVPGPRPEPQVDQARIDRSWMAVSTELFAPAPGRLERLLERLSVPEPIARLMAATPALRRAWYVAVGLIVLIGLSFGDGTKPREDLFMLLLLAPLVPVFGVSMAYGADADPAYESSLATPLSGFRLVMIRATTVVALSVVVLAIVSLLSGAVSVMAFGWLLPSLGLTSVSLALMTFTTPRRAGSIAAVSWVVGVTVVRSGTVDPLAAFLVTGQLLMVVIGAIALGISYQRRDRFDLLAVG